MGVALVPAVADDVVGVLPGEAVVVGAGVDGVRVVADAGPGPSGSTMVVGPPVVGLVVADGVAVSVVDGAEVSVEVSVVVGVVSVGVLTLVRGTQVYAGSGTKPGGTTAVSGADGFGTVGA
jgi:hypothetical protein